MANMSYCRFRNTYNDLSDCFEALEREDGLSENEKRACKSIFNSVIEFFLNAGIIDEEEEAIRERVEEYLGTIEVDDY